MTDVPNDGSSKPAHSIVVTIDGPAASGKSSTAQWVARRLGFRHVDSGALYRAATARTLHSKQAPGAWSESDVIRYASEIGLVPDGTSFVPAHGGVALGDEIRGPDVTAAVSRVAQMPTVRAWVNAMVQGAARRDNVVVDGRDMGTAVFPDAAVKIFLVADPWERARRRLKQRLGRGPSDDEIAVETDALVHRDAQDATQSAQARDAILVDTTYLTQAEQVDRIVSLVRSVTDPERSRG